MMMMMMIIMHAGTLGVSTEDFVARLESSPESSAGSDLLETVLAMDDFVQFKRMSAHFNTEHIEYCLRIPIGKQPNDKTRYDKKITLV